MYVSKVCFSEQTKEKTGGITMQRIWKQLLAVLLSAVLLVSAAPAAGFAGVLNLLNITASAENYSGSCGNNVTWKLDTENGVLTISGTGQMSNYSDWSSKRAPWYSYRSTIQSVVIENGVTSIGNYAFCDCSDSMNVLIADSVTGVGDYAFERCKVSFFAVSENNQNYSSS